MNLTVACVFVRGEYPYTVEYVSRLRDMVARWIDRPFRFACLTDQPELMPVGVEPVPVTKLAGFAPWTKLELFNPARKWPGRVLYLDLDVLIVAPLKPIIDVESNFAITADPASAHKPRTVDSFGRQIVRKFNSSVMVFHETAAKSLYTQWTPDIAEKLSGDQDHIGSWLPHATALPRTWFPRISELNGKPPVPPAKIVLCKVPKNHVAAEQYPWVAPLWGAA